MVFWRVVGAVYFDFSNTFDNVPHRRYFHGRSLTEKSYSWLRHSWVIKFNEVKSDPAFSLS